MGLLLPKITTFKAVIVQNPKRSILQMSPHAANSLVADLVEMAKAHERLPEVMEELATLRQQLDDNSTTIQRLEGKLLDRANEINDLRSQLRSVEVARDDAEYRFLESDEKVGQIAKAFKAALSAVVDTEKLIEDVTKKPEPLIEQPIEQTLIQPEVQSTDEQPVGQSESHPTVSEPQSETGSNVQSISVSISENASQPLMTEHSSESERGPYSNLDYQDIPRYIPLTEWLDGGGTEEAYWYRGHKRHVA
jgi:chromosome segregation ATPase